MIIEIIDYLLLPVIFFIGLVTSWEDFQRGLIRNKWIFGGFVYGLAVYLFLSVFLILDINYFIRVLANSLVTLYISFILWRSRMVAAGDAKLFFVFAWLLPLKYYWRSYYNYFPSIALLLNIFLPIFFFIFIKAILFSIIKIIKILSNPSDKNIYIHIWEMFKKNTPTALRKISLIIISVTFIRDLNTLFTITALQAINFLPIVIIILFILRRQLFRFIHLKLKKWKFIIFFMLSFILSFTYNIYRFGTFAALERFKTSIMIGIIYSVSFVLLGYVLDNYVKDTMIQTINIKDLSVGMKPKLDKKSIKRLGPIPRTGITIEQAETIKSWQQMGEINKIGIYRKAPFAVWVFIGVIITIIFQGSVFHLILNYINGR